MDGQRPAPPLEVVADRLSNYGAAQKASFSNVDVEERRDFDALRDLVRDASESPPASTAVILRLIGGYLSLLEVPEAACDVAALPLPHPPKPPTDPPAVDAKEAAVPSLLAGTVPVEGARPALAQCNGPLPLDSPMRSARAHARAAGADNEHGSGPSYGIDPAGVRFNDHVRMRGWARQAELVLEGAIKAVGMLAPAQTAVQQGSDDSIIPEAIAVRLLVCVAPFLCYASWSTPGHSTKALALLQTAAQVDSSRRKLDPRTAAHHVLDPVTHPFVLSHIDGLLSWCREHSLGGAWKERRPSTAAVRWVILFAITAVTFPHMNARVAALCTPLAFRLADDWEVTNVWVGASCVGHILANGLPTDFRTGAGGPMQATLVAQCVSRALTVRHPTLSHTLGYVVAVYLPVMYGSPPAHGIVSDVTAIAKVIRNGSEASSAGGTVLGMFDHPTDVALGDQLRHIALAGGTAVQYGLVAWLVPLVLQMGPRAARHVGKLLQLCSRVCAESVDARLTCAALQLLRAVACAAPGRFTVDGDGTRSNAAAPHGQTDSRHGSNNSSGSLTQQMEESDVESRCTAVEEALSSCVSAVMQALAGFASLPACDAEGMLVYALDGSEGRPSRGSAVSPAVAGRELVLRYARASVADLTRLSPAHVEVSLQAVRQAAGSTTAEYRVLHEALAQLA